MAGAKAGPLIVGQDGVDDTAVVASGNTIAWAEGSFPSVSGVTSADSSSFTLQLNSQYITYPNQSSSPCANGLASCQGWAQFAYQPNRGVWIEYWLINYGKCTNPNDLSTCNKVCPGSPWRAAPITVTTSKYYGMLGCVLDTGSTPVSPQPAATELSRISLTGTTGSGGDAVLMTVGSTMYAHGQSGNPVLLSSYWNTAEFNIFGYGNGSGYNFVENNVSLVVQILTDSATTSAAPKCGGQTYTGESNNLTLVPNSCCPISGTGTTPGIQFMESNLSSPTKQACPLFPVDPNWTTVEHPFDAIVMGTDVGGTPLSSCRVNYQGSWQPGKIRPDWVACQFPYGSQEIQWQPYETLVASWVDAKNGNVPTGAMQFGNDGTNGPALYPCRAYLDYNGFQLGKVRSGFSGCNIPYGGSEHTVTNYQVLTSTVPLTTQAVNSATPPSGALVGGYDLSGGTNTPLYVCQAQYPAGGGMVPGKVAPGWTNCNVAYGGSEYSVSSYNVLVPNFKSPPGTVFKAGTDTNGSTLGICNAGYQNSTQVGKYISDGHCNFGYGNGEVSLSSGYKVLSK